MTTLDASSIDVGPPPSRFSRAGSAAYALLERSGLARVVASSAVVLGTWELVGRTVLSSSLFFVPFSDVVAALVDMVLGGGLWIHLYYSLAALGLGFVGGSIVGVAIGIVMGANGFAYRLMSPWVALAYASPLVALTPLFILSFGVGIASKVALVLVVSIFPVAVNTTAGFRAADRRYVEMAESFGGDRRRIVRKVLLPASLPFVLSGLRLASGRAVVGVVVGEFFVARAGLGYLISRASQVFRMDQLFAGVILFAFIGLALFSLFEWMERRLTPWRAPTEEVEG